MPVLGKGRSRTQAGLKPDLLHALHRRLCKRKNEERERDKKHRKVPYVTASTHLHSSGSSVPLLIPDFPVLALESALSHPVSPDPDTRDPTGSVGFPEMLVPACPWLQGFDLKVIA